MAIAVFHRKSPLPSLEEWESAAKCLSSVETGVGDLAEGWGGGVELHGLQELEDDLWLRETKHTCVYIKANRLLLLPVPCAVWVIYWEEATPLCHGEEGQKKQKQTFFATGRERESYKETEKKNIPSHADLHYHTKPSLESHQTPCSLFQIWLLKKHSWKPSVFPGSISCSLCSLFTKLFITTGN